MLLDFVDIIHVHLCSDSLLTFCKNYRELRLFWILGNIIRRERCNEEKNTLILATDTMIPQRKSDVFEKSHDVTKHLGFSSAIHSWREAKAGVVVTGENHSGGGWRGREPLSLSLSSPSSCRLPLC